MNKVEIIKYSERAIVVAGDTKPIKEMLKQQGGKFNARLKHPVTQLPLVGWIFSASRLSALEMILAGNNVKYDRLTPSNFNDKTAHHFGCADPAEIHSG